MRAPCEGPEPMDTCLFEPQSFLLRAPYGGAPSRHKASMEWEKLQLPLWEYSTIPGAPVTGFSAYLPTHVS
jgi:hypothetical protein